jgi:hypothetical protein
MDTKHPMSPSSSCPIKPHCSHRPFALSCATTNQISIPFPRQSTHPPIVPLPILTNHTPRIDSFYWPPTLHVNAGTQPYNFPNPLDHAHVRPFPLFTLPTPLVAYDQTPQPTFISWKQLQLPSKISYPTYWRQFTDQGLICHQHYC